MTADAVAFAGGLNNVRYGLAEDDARIGLMLQLAELSVICTRRSSVNNFFIRFMMRYRLFR